MAQEGPLLASVRRLAEDLSVEEILGLPEPALPVRLWSDDGERLRVDVLVGLGAEHPGDREAALGRLRAEDREAIVARIEFGQSYDELALTLDKPSRDAARVAVSRALVRLAAEMKADRRE